MISPLLLNPTASMPILFQLSQIRAVLLNITLDQKLQQSFLAECYLLQETWFVDPACLYTMSDNLNLDSWDSGESHYFNNILDPCLLAARSVSSKYNEDNPSFDTATRGPFQAQF
jgi:hypothetical protein